MADHSKSPPRWNWLKLGSANATFVVLAVLGIGAVGAGIAWSNWQRESWVSLLEGSKLLDHDLARMQLAFGGAGLNQFEIRDGQVFVPQSQRDRFLKSLHDHDGIPESSREIYEPASQNPWATSQQMQESLLLRKKRMIRSLVLQLEFVADAVVDYDELVEEGWPPTTHRSAAVVVRPKGDRLLESYQVDAIRNTICGAVAGLEPHEIVVTDISAGHAYVGQIDDPSSTPPEHLAWLEQAKIEQRVNDRLLQFGEGIEAHVTLDNEVVKDDTDLKLKIAAPSPPHSDVPIANQPASIATSAALANGCSTEESSDVECKTIRIKINLPERCVREFTSTRSGEIGAELTLEQRFQLLQADVQSAVLPLISGDQFPWKRHVINVAIVKDANQIAPVIDRPTLDNAWTNNVYVPAIGIGLGVFALLKILATWYRAQSRRASVERDRLSRRANAEMDEMVPRTFADTIPDETKRRLSQMVAENPDQAAEIIKQWIREAA